jgi:N-acetylglutamate synthase-like GNAT family acetyltransferase
MEQSSTLEFLPFSDELSPYFDSINREWIESMFVLEPIDENVISRPKEFIINSGGHIWFAKHPTLGVVGTCALAKKSEGVFELTKMGVVSNVRGLKIGEQLLQYVLTLAPSIAHEALFLLTNKRCEAAIHLYQKNGFVHCKETMNKYGSAYERCDVAMRYTR